MADYAPVAAQAKPPQQMTLADMVNMAGGIQQYQQREATNPLALQQQQYLTQTAGQQARTGEIGLGVAEQQAKERPLLQQFFSDSSNYTTDGQYDARKALAGVSQIAPLTGPEYLKNLAGTMQAQSQESEAAIKAKQAAVGLNTDQLKNLQAQQQNSSRNLLSLLSKKTITPQDIEDHVKSTMTAANAPQNAIDQELAKLPKTGTQSELKAFIAKHATNSLTAEAQLEKLFPKAQMESFGGTKKPVQLENKAFTNVEPGAVVGPETAMTLAPTVVTSETGAPKIMGGGVNKPTPTAVDQTTQPTQPTAPKATQPKPATNKMVQDFEKSGGLQIGPGETYDAYKARVGRLGALPDYAAKSMSLANPESVPNTQKINNNILTLLDDKDVNVGKVADLIAGKTAGITLNSKEQVIQKYLEQRARQISTRSNQDAASVKQALGGFGNDKDALRTIIYNDAGTLAAENLYNQGILKARGSSGKPNLAAVADFEQKFSNLATDPDVLHLIGVVGNKSINQLSKSDTAHFQKYFKGKNLENLFKQKEALENLVKGTQ
jgi:hypothetical protein